MKLEKIGRYEITAEMGKKVYRAFDPDFGRDVILIKWDWIVSEDSKILHKFMKKARGLIQLKHRSIVPVYDVGEIDGKLYFVTKFMTGGSLADRLTQNPLAVNDVANILNHIALGLDEAHKRGYVHSNIKPKKILFDDANKSYVTDFFFGILRDFNDEAGSVSGTPRYMSPEQAVGKKIDYRSDIYSLGIVLFETLSGEVPYGSDTTFGILMKHLNESPPNILDINPNLPPITRKFIEKAIAKAPEDRFASVGEMAATLETIVNRIQNPQTNFPY